MRKIPLNFQTMYADLAQNVSFDGAQAGSVSKRSINGRAYLYVTTKDGATRRQRSLGPADDPAAQAEADTIRQAAARAKSQRTTVSALKMARVPAPSLELGRVLEAVSNAGLFRRGVVLVGTTAFQTYACGLGYYMPSAAVMTNDVDLLVASLVVTDTKLDLEHILQRADPTFRAHMNIGDPLPKIFIAANSIQVDVLTALGRGRTTPIPVEALTCAAEALPFMEYLTEDGMDAVVLYGPGIAVRVPSPLRYAVHKLIVAQLRRGKYSIKKRKDLVQATDLIDVFLDVDSDALGDTLELARARGPSWKKAINASLRELGRETRDGVPPSKTR